MELLTIQLRLVVCSVEKARELGLDWWTRDSALNLRNQADPAIEERIAKLEAIAAKTPGFLSARPRLAKRLDSSLFHFCTLIKQPDRILAQGVAT